MLHMGWSVIYRAVQCPLIRAISFGQSLHQRGMTTLPPRPKPPSESDCCNSGCDLCVKDIHEQELKIWENECNNILLGQAPKSSLTPDTYTKCRLLDIKSVNHNTSVYTFDSLGYVEIKPGQHLILRELIEGISVTRQYTPIAVPNPQELTFKVLIKHYIDGCITSHIKTKWQVGDEVEWRGPHGMFLHSPNKYMKYIMLAAGTGIAPMINVCKDIVRDDGDITTLRLLYACKTYEDILLSSDLKQVASHWNFTYKTFLSQEKEVEKKRSYGENLVSGKITKDDIDLELINPLSTRVLICGTREFNSAMIDHCNQLNIQTEHIFKF